LGVSDSRAITYDFAAFGVTEGTMAFGPPLRHLPLTPELAAMRGSNASWDDWLASSVDVFNRPGVEYNFLTTNCHSFVAHFLNSIAYTNFRHWNAVRLGVLMMLKGHWVSRAACVRTLAPFAIFMLVGWHFGHTLFLTTYLVLTTVFILWFAIYSNFIQSTSFVMSV
jgi:hypothetical protein